MSKPNSIRFRLNISTDEYLAYYQQRAQEVVARAEDGRLVRFPANALQRFITHQGVLGLFELSFDENGKLIALERISG